MDVVQLDPKSSDQILPFWDEMPIHGALLVKSNVIIRIFSNTKDWTRHQMSFTSTDVNVTPVENAAYVDFVRAKNYDGVVKEFALCYTPEGPVGYLSRECFAEPGFYARDAQINI